MENRTELIARLARETGIPEADLQPPKKHTIRRYIDSEHSDGVGGLHLVISANGRYAWSVRVSVPKTQTRPRIPLGNASSLFLVDAITKARAQHKLTAEGFDPKALRLAEREQLRAAKQARKASRRTVRELLNFYVQKLENENRPSAKQTAGLFKEPPAELVTRKGVSRTQLKPILAWLDKPAVSVDEAAAQSIIKQYEARGLGMAQQALEHLRAAWNVVWNDLSARQSFGLKSNPFAGIKVSEPIDTSADEDEEDGPTRALEEHEIPKLWHGLSETTKVRAGHGAMLPVRSDDRTRIALLLEIACGQRVEQVLKTRRKDIDFKRKIWNIPLAHRKTRRSRRKSKRPTDKGPHPVPLHPIALALWREAIALCTDPDNPWIFPAKDKDGFEQHRPREHNSLAKFVNRWCKRTGFTPFTPRDLRRTFKTQAARWRLDYMVVERIQDRVIPGVGASNYDFYDYADWMCEVMDIYGEKLAALLAPPSDANVVPFQRTRQPATPGRAGVHSRV